MRSGLQPFLGQRLTVTAQVIDFGSHIGWTGSSEPTILLGPVRSETGVLLADHVWMRFGKHFNQLTPKMGDTLGFSARVSIYYRGRTVAARAKAKVDYQLVYPTRCTVLARWWAPNPRRHMTTYLRKSLPSARTQVLFAIAVLSLEDTEPPSLTKIQARAGVTPQACLSVLKRLGKTGEVVFTPSGRVLPAQLPARHQIALS